MNFSEFLQPAIFALTGKPGAGKSYFATRCIIAEIMEGSNRTIVTNVPINRQKLRDYCKKDFNLYDLETFSDNRFFFSNRGHYRIQIDNASENLDFSEKLQDDDDGILYIIDEAHLYFNARNWKHLMGATLSYITFIRHIGDTCIYMCQKFSDIDSQFRGKTQAFHLLRNLAKEKYGWFKRGTGFRCYQYMEEQHISTHGSSTENAVQDFQYPFKLSIAECYNTSLFNKGHDKKYKVRGIPLNYVWYSCGVLLIIVLIWVYNGGLTSAFSASLPDMISLGDNEESEQKAGYIPNPNQLTGTTSSSQSSQPSEQVEIVEKRMLLEQPKFAFTGGTLASSEKKPFISVNYEESLHFRKHWLGRSVPCKLTFIADKATDDNRKGFQFQIQWNKFSNLSQVKLGFTPGLYQIGTDYFNGFLEYVEDNSDSVTLKSTEFILKENTKFKMDHGFQLPFDSTITNQGVVSKSREYKQVGFQIELAFENIENINLLVCRIQNSDVMDISDESPILQTFTSASTTEVEYGYSYLIADFNSKMASKTKGFLRSTNYESTLNNKIYISFGQADI